MQVCGVTGNGHSGHMACSIPPKNALKEIGRDRRSSGAEECLEGDKTKWSFQLKTENVKCGID